MRSIGFAAVAVLLLACLVFGAACAGEKGEQGSQGEPGPNMIVAMGTISENCTIDQGYNVSSCVRDQDGSFVITLTGIDYSVAGFVTQVALLDNAVSPLNITCAESQGRLQVNVWVFGDNPPRPFHWSAPFSFVVLECPQTQPGA